MPAICHRFLSLSPAKRRDKDIAGCPASPRRRVRPASIGLPLLLAIVALAAFGRSVSAETWADWREAGPFICRADFPLKGMEGLFDDLAQLQNDLVRYLGIQPAREPIELYLFRDQRGYRQFVSRYLPQVPYRRALYVKSNGIGMVFAHLSRDFAVDIRHECTHALLHASLPMVPLWLDEGLAEYFEVAPAERAFGNPHLSGIRWGVRLRLLPRVENLEKLRDLSEMNGSEYRDAWAWTHFLLHGPPEARHELVRFLADIQAHTPPGLLSQRLERRLPEVQHRFAGHFRSWKR